MNLATDRISKAFVAALMLLPTAALHAVEPIPAFTPGARILFQGDSITDGNRGRSADPNHILGHGYVFIIAAKFGGAFPQANLEFFNRGTSGNNVLDLEKRWQKDTLDLKPAVLSILIGVNDRRRVPLDQYERTYDNLLSDAKAANPKLKLVLCEPFVVNHRATTPQHRCARCGRCQRAGDRRPPGEETRRGTRAFPGRARSCYRSGLPRATGFGTTSTPRTPAIKSSPTNGNAWSASSGNSGRSSKRFLPFRFRASAHRRG